MRRLHALWALSGLDALDASVLATLVLDADARLREHALKATAIAEPSRRGRLLLTSTLNAMAEDPAIRVRLQAALALGDRCAAEPSALAALAKIAARDALDPWMRLAIASGLGESALGFIPRCLAIPRSAGRTELLAQTASIVGVRRRMPELAALLTMVAAPQAEARLPAAAFASSEADSLTMLAGLAAGLERSGPGFHPLFEAQPDELRAPLGQVARLLSAAAAAAVSAQPAAERITAIDVLARCWPVEAEAVVPKLLAVREPPEIQAAAVHAVARVRAGLLWRPR